MASSRGAMVTVGQASHTTQSAETFCCHYSWKVYHYISGEDEHNVAFFVCYLTLLGGN